MAESLIRKPRKIWVRVSRIVVKTMVILLLLLVIVLFLIQTSFVQDFARKKIESYLQSKLHTRVRIGDLSVKFPQKIVLTGIYLEDLHQDTLLAAGRLEVDLAMWQLLRHRVHLRALDIDHLTLRIHRQGLDSSFNYAFILQAFAPNARPEEQPASSTPFAFVLGAIHIRSLSASYQDYFSGLEGSVNLGDLQAQVKTFDPALLVFSVPDIRLAEVTGHLHYYHPSRPPGLVPIVEPAQRGSTSQAQLSIELGRVALEHIAFAYTDELNGLRATLNLGGGQADASHLDLSKKQFAIKRVILDNTQARLRLDNNGPTNSTAVSARSQNAPSDWSFRVDSLGLDRDQVQYDDDSKQPSTEGLDYNHLQVVQLRVLASGLAMDSSGYKGKVGQISLVEKSGLQLKSLSGAIQFNNRRAELANLRVQTNRSQLIGRVTLGSSSGDSFTQNPGNMGVDLQFERSSVGTKDLLIFAPALGTRLRGYENSTFILSGRLTGRLKDLEIRKLEIAGLHNSIIQLTGRVKGLPDAAKAQYDIQLHTLQTGDSDLRIFIPATVLPANVFIPSILTASGSFNGTLDVFSATLHVGSEQGSLDLRGGLNRQNQSFSLEGETQQLDLGRLFGQQDWLGKESVQLHASGTGFDYKTTQTIFSANLLEGTFRGYTYHRLLVDGSLQNGQAVITSSIQDPNIRYRLNAKLGLAAKFPAVDLNFSLDTLNPLALHWTQDSLQWNLGLRANFSNTDPDALQGQLTVYHIGMAQPNRRLVLDSVEFKATRTGSAEHLSLQSDLVQASWDGEYKISEVSQALQETINRYYLLGGYSPALVSPQRWKLILRLNPSPGLLFFAPEWQGSDTVRATIDFASQDHALQVDLRAPHLQFQGQRVDQLHAIAFAMDSAFAYHVDFSGAEGAGIHLYHSSLEGSVAANQLFASLRLQDNTQRERYLLKLRASQVNHGLQLAFGSDSLMLNYDPWTISPDNFIRIDSSGFLVHNLKINHGQESLAVNSQSLSTQAPVDIGFSNFHMRTLTEFASQDSLFVDGLVNGRATIEHLAAGLAFTSDLAISDLAYRKDTIGNLRIQVSNLEQDRYRANLALTGVHNQVSLNGTYLAGQRNMDLQLAIAKLSLGQLKPFTKDLLKDISGNLSGELQATGSLTEPTISGHFHFDTTRITPVLSGETLKIPSDDISFDKNHIVFKQFTIMDTSGNKAIVDGTIMTKDFKRYLFDLSLKTRDFRVVNAPKEADRLFYGKLNLDADVTVKGSMSTPKINADLRVNKATDLTLILPSSDPEEVSREGVVVFRDKNHPADSATLKAKLDSLTQESEVKGIEVSATIQTDSNAQFTMIIDERNGDALAVRGRADLVGGLDKSGKMTLAGNYELESGSYSVSLSLLKRKFLIQRGSTITWTGAPETANIDISAIYPVSAAPIDLLEQQLSGLSEDELNRLRQKLPFQVNMKMTGELLKPIISFEITLPQNILSQYPDVENKLQQIKSDESEVNKQVLALLLLGRFVQENLLANATPAASTAMLAKQSVSSILTEQLNALAGSLIKGVDLNFDLNSENNYYTGQQVAQTELNVVVSKKLFNDRVSVTVGSNFQLDNTLPGQSTTNIAGDIKVDYRLSKDGKYMIRVYRKDQYDTVVEGQVVQTGLSFILTLDYNKLSELFNNAKERKRNKKANQTAPSGNPNSSQ
jgi:TamB, inner membrane protein subunit of TAM complex